MGSIHATITIGMMKQSDKLNISFLGKTKVHIVRLPDV